MNAGFADEARNSRKRIRAMFLATQRAIKGINRDVTFDRDERSNLSSIGFPSRARG
jgi:hypothetical protein